MNQLVMMKVYGWRDLGSDFFGFLKISRLVYGWLVGWDNDGGTRRDLGPDPPHEDDTK